jgi:hypothetical protein
MGVQWIIKRLSFPGARRSGIVDRENGLGSLVPVSVIELADTLGNDSANLCGQ